MDKINTIERDDMEKHSKEVKKGGGYVMKGWYGIVMVEEGDVERKEWKNQRISILKLKWCET